MEEGTQTPEAEPGKRPMCPAVRGCMRLYTAGRPGTPPREIEKDLRRFRGSREPTKAKQEKEPGTRRPPARLLLPAERAVSGFLHRG